MEAVRDYLNAVVRITFKREAFQVQTDNCTANLRPFMVDSPSLIQFEVCKVDVEAPTATLCLCKHITNEWLLHASCKVRLYNNKRLTLLFRI